MLDFVFQGFLLPVQNTTISFSKIDNNGTIRNGTYPFYATIPYLAAMMQNVAWTEYGGVPKFDAARDER